MSDVTDTRQLFRCVVPPGCIGQRLDQFLPTQIPTLSRTALRKVIDLGGIHVNGRRTRQNGLLLKAADAIEVHLDGRPLEPFRLEERDILWQDSYLVVLNKPAGVETQPTPARYKGTLYEALLVFLERDRHLGRKPEIGMVQRLDRDTSGVIVFSIHPRAHGPLSRQMAERDLDKRYWALVHGCPPPEGEWRSLLARERRTNLMKSVAVGGKEAVTRFRVLASQPTVSLLELTLLTGRSHQIRVHCSEAGYPLLGDSRYGGPTRWQEVPVPRQMLHARYLQLKHPVTGDIHLFEAPLPADFHSLCGQCGVTGHVSLENRRC